MSQAKSQLVVCGSIAIDRIMNFNGRYADVIQPDKIHILSISLLLDKLENSPGGIGPNIAYSLAKLGDRPVLIGSVGHDGESYVKQLAASGIDTTNVHYSDLPTASFNVITDSDGNQVGGFFQGAMSDSQAVSFKPWAGQDILAMVSPHNPAAMNRQVAECAELNLRLAYDPGQQVADDSVDLAAGVNAAEILFVNDYELSVLCKKTGLSPAAIKQKIPLVVTTLGKAGSVIEGAQQEKPIEIGIAPVESIDPTGAGDAYRAGFVYGYLRQWDLKKCGQLGATVASFIVEKHGTQQDFSLDEVKARYQQNFNEEVEL